MHRPLVCGLKRNHKYTNMERKHNKHKAQRKHTINMKITMKNNPVNKWVNNCKIINRRCCYIANLLTGLFLFFLSFISPNKKDNQGVCHV